MASVKKGVVSVTIPLSVTPETRDMIDQARGMIPRATYIRHIITQYLLQNVLVEGAEEKAIDSSEDGDHQIGIPLPGTQSELTTCSIKNGNEYLVRGYFTFQGGKTSDNELINKRGVFITDLFSLYVGTELNMKFDDMSRHNYHFEVITDQSFGQIQPIQIQKELDKGKIEGVFSSCEISILEKESGMEIWKIK